MQFQRLLAKSLPAELPDGRSVIPDSVYLPNHLADVAASNQAIISVTGLQMLEALGLPAGWLPRLEAVSSLAALLHDLGKANFDFQKAVRPSEFPDHRQAIRHEWISVWIACQPEMKKWLLPAVDNCELCWHIAMYAISGHHPKYNRAAPNDDCLKADPIVVAFDHPDFQKCLEQIRDWFGLDQSLPRVAPSVYAGAGDRKGKLAFMDFLDEFDAPWRNEIKVDEDWQKFSAIVKASLVAADVAGSALWEKIESPEQRSQWIQEALSRNPSQNDLRSIVKARLKKLKAHDFQTRIEQSTASVTLVEAGCGSGKTAAAYMWAAEQQANRRLWFCYPTTGTATEGYKGYLIDKFPANYGVRTDLFHSRREYDVRMMLETGKSSGEDLDESAICIDSLKAWDTQIVACTVDNVLMLLQNGRRGLYAWPALANSSLVFDEIHCYDDVLFGNLLTWLETMTGIPVLLMTASLPQGKRDAIMAAVQKSNRTFAHVPRGPDELEQLPRYHRLGGNEVKLVPEANEFVSQELESGGRVLWISNTVERTCNVADRFPFDEPIVYHSRFLYKDRGERHTEVVDLFQSNEKSGFATTSQVAELSLDLAYVTLLITELAPIPALIQRLGRLARRVEAIDTYLPGKWLVIEPQKDDKFSAAPYKDHELELARTWLAKLPDSILSQRDLVEAWHELDSSVRHQPVESAWITGGPKTPVDAIRESGYGVTVIRAEDLIEAKSHGATAYTLPMERPTKENWKEAYPFRGYPVASAGTISYDPQRGGQWTTHFDF